ncbi:MAG: CotH kinase family protein [Lachnospiraceae bacterium]|nr:CotH kinase family protein [Lachnospiraceae bacterium]
MEIKINEVCTSNLCSCFDEYGGTPDWIELYNPNDRAVDLTGWHLSDSEKRLDKWEFPAAQIEPHGYLLIYASGWDGDYGKSDEKDFNPREWIVFGGRSKEDNGLHASFRLSSEGVNLYLSDAGKKLIDYVEVPKLRYDTVYGRTRDGNMDFERLTATPLSSNEASDEAWYPDCASPVISHDSGFFEAGIDLSIDFPSDIDETHIGGCEIRYTMDGSIPDSESELFQGSLHLGEIKDQPNRYSEREDISPYYFSYMKSRGYEVPAGNVQKCTVLRAAVFSGGKRVSETADRVFFIGELPEEYEGTGIISLITDPDNFFGYKNGIYVIGEKGEEDFKSKLMEDAVARRLIEEDPTLPLNGSVSINGIGMGEYVDANYRQEGALWERPALMTVFDSSKNKISEQRIGVRIKGHRSRSFPQKSLNLFARKCYSGSEFFDRTLTLGMGLEGEALDLSRLSLNTCAQDEKSKVRDEFLSRLCLEGGLKVDSVHYMEPYFVFLNGEFWGTYLLSNSQDTSYLAAAYEVPEMDVIRVKNEWLEDGDNGRKPSGTDIYWGFRGFLSKCDLSQKSDYERFQEYMDIESLIDYYSLRIYMGKAMDWPIMNTGMWRYRKEEKENRDLYPMRDGRWRWLNYDNNSDIQLEYVSVNSFEKVYHGGRGLGDGDEVLQKLMESDEFRKKFKERFLELSSQVFSYEKALPIFRDVVMKNRKAAIIGNKRYFGASYSEAEYEKEIQDMEEFLKLRASYIVPVIEEAMK